MHTYVYTHMHMCLHINLYIMNVTFIICSIFTYMCAYINIHTYTHIYVYKKKLNNLGTLIKTALEVIFWNFKLVNLCFKEPTIIFLLLFNEPKKIT